ncbi:MAG: respiratory nitrate reductase subunit gamma, partial [Kocuria sp.]|nr:respiratory nitrate reductase subunit gamma [Kocuria sp.]
APVHYLFRPYIVYRSRGSQPHAGSVGVRRGWEPIGTQDRASSRRRTRPPRARTGSTRAK